MNILYLIHALKNNADQIKLSELAAAIEAAPLDMNLAIWDAIDRGEIEIDEDKDTVKVLKEWEPWHNPELAGKLLRVVQHYAANKTNITRGRLQSYMKDLVTNEGYPLHEYLMTLQYLVGFGHISEYVVSVPEVKKKRPFHRFVFLCLPENEAHNEEWNAAAVNKWIANFEEDKVK